MSRPAPRLLVAVALGGALGAALRHLLEQAAPDPAGFPWTTLVINVVGSALLAALPLVGAIRRSQTATAALGAGVLGGFTTLSATSEQARVLVAQGQSSLAAAYLVGTLGAALIAVLVVSRLVTARERPVAGGELES